ncbi:11169_t:CDS:2, partial [Gigaspora margarita]
EKLGEKPGKESGDKLGNELGKEIDKKIHSAIEFVDGVINNEALSKTERLTIFYVESRERIAIVKKKLGSAMHISDFLAKTIEPLRNSQKEAHIIMVLGTNQNGYWDSKKLLKQDTFVTSKMNLGPGGSASKMQK